MSLTHLNARGEAHMVDIADKPESRREALASGYILMRPETLALVSEGGLPKGDVLATARIAGIQAAKRTHELIPLCHALALSKVEIDFHLNDEKSCIEVFARCRLNGRTGVEMEALTAVSVACLTLYDMCKAVDKEMQIGNIQLETKQGGKSGDYRRAAADTIVAAAASSGRIGLPLGNEVPSVHVKCLAELREQLGVSDLDVPFDDLPSRDVAGLKAALKAIDPRFERLEQPRVLCAINQVMGSADTPLTDGDEIAFFPPVTGG
ncbi:cyclic pyranopterin monophosphate synthase MoaC [Pistricoccus aurantiacus]|uniref:Cyclic pyranopterin monophosphate synthase n=1 Tax=Pistricoccus aurantiacus TaxID=1883414 RepID=A0A5B8SYC1_9GAMM|nr:cyclic pyranopterin monophosphate synthase MoaC [Pistricoccus aurantiacus]QEA39823.1 cyclic pyranopterin monophosphate synthase MoaC [Pistricoccus aurantiacus]